MSELINGAKLLAKIRKRMTDTNQVIDYFDVAHFELSWIEKWILKEMKANGDEKSDKPALHKHIVSNNEVAVCDCGKPIDPDYDPCCSYPCWHKKFD